MLNGDYRYCVKFIQFQVKLVAGYKMIFVINNENLLELFCFSFFRF